MYEQRGMDKPSSETTDYVNMGTRETIGVIMQQTRVTMVNHRTTYM